MNRSAFRNDIGMENCISFACSRKKFHALSVDPDLGDMFSDSDPDFRSGLRMTGY